MISAEKKASRDALYYDLCFVCGLAGSPCEEEKVKEAYEHYKSYKRLTSQPELNYQTFQGKVGAFSRNRERTKWKLDQAPISVLGFMRDTLGIDVSGIDPEQGA